jgi:PTH1 family peptidyl-tRNA hydrolase
MKLIVGLGNPEKRYEKTRHNVGFLFVDYLAKSLNLEIWEENKRGNFLSTSASIGDENFVLMKPLTYMNDSGFSVSHFKRKNGLKGENIFVVHDDLDLKIGEYKIQQGVGPKVHNGVNSIEDKIGDKDFWRIRIGVDNRESANRIPGEDYVLQNFTPDEIEIVNKVIEEICKKFPTF